jgi:tetratricopeptide (TPR) repeat protein
VHEETEGNPFFVGQVLRHLVESGAIIEVDGQWVRARDTAGAGIPEGIREVIGRRLAMLSEEANELLAAASVLGREFAIDVLQAAADARHDAVLDAMEVAEAAHVIEPVPGVPKNRSFVHALFRSTLYDEIPTTRRLRLHRRVAQALESRTGTKDGLPLAELARHYCEAAALGETENAVRFSVAAAEQARERLAYEEAAELYERALAVLDPSAPDDQEARARLFLALGRARWAAGDRDGAQSALIESGEIARRRGDAELFAEAAIARGGKRGWSEAGVVDETLVSLLEESLTLLPEGDHPLRAMAMARLASELYFLTAESERRSRLTEDAVAMARRCCEGADLAVVLSSAHWGAWVPGNAADRLVIAEEMLELGLGARDREVELTALIWKTPDLMELQRAAEAAEAVERALELADDLRLPEYRWGARVQKTCLLLMKGAYEEADALALEANVLGQAMQTETATQMFGVAHLHLTRARGGVEEMEPLVLAMVERYPLIPAWRTGLALVYAELERDDDLREQVDLLAKEDFNFLPRDANWVVAHAVLSFGCAYLGDVPLCTALYERLLPLAPFAVIVGSPADCLGPVEGFLAPLAVVLGDFERADAHFSAAIEACEQMGNLAGAANMAYAYGIALQRHGGPERDAGAKNVLNEAATRAEAVGMPRVAERARNRASES